MDSCFDNGLQARLLGDWWLQSARHVIVMCSSHSIIVKVYFASRCEFQAFLHSIASLQPPAMPTTMEINGVSCEPASVSLRGSETIRCIRCCCSCCELLLLLLRGRLKVSVRVVAALFSL
jgi:hypothetical protein